MIDILGAVNDFVLRFAHAPGLPPLSQSQLVRGWQNYGGLPPQTQEIAVLTLLEEIRHGTNVHRYRNGEENGLIQTVARLGEHRVQLDFCSASPNQAEYTTRTRAGIIEILTRDRVGVNFFRSYGLSACYADSVRPLPFIDETKQWITRYSVTLHLTGWSVVDLEQPAFTTLDLYLENVDEHHPSGSLSD